MWIWFGLAAFYLIGAMISHAPGAPGVPLTIAAVFSLPGFGLLLWRIQKAQNEAEQVRAAKRAADLAEEYRLREEARRREEAEQLAQLELLHKMNGHIEQSVAEMTLMPQLLARARADLETAEQEFVERAYSPFWIAIEDASSALERYSTAVTNVEHHSRQYLEARGRYSASPPTYAVAAAYHDPSYIVSSMKEIVRRAQKDFEFSSIYEQRQTNTILRTGFGAMASSIASLGDRLSRSIDDMGGRVVAEIRDASDAVTAAIDAGVDRQIDAIEHLGNEIGAASFRAEESHLQTTQNQIERELAEQRQRRRFEADVQGTLHDIHDDVHRRR